MDLIEGTNRISNEKDRIDRIFFDSREEVCRVLKREATQASGLQGLTGSS